MVCLLLFLAGCSAAKPADDSTPKEEATPVKVDLSSPLAAMKTFVAASQEEDIEALSACVAEGAAAEFKKLRDQEASEADLEGLRKLLKEAELGDPVVKGERAEVPAKLESREETFHFEKTENGWQLVDF